MRVNYTHQRSCGKCQTASYRIETTVGVPLQGGRIFAVSCRAMGKKRQKKEKMQQVLSTHIFSSSSSREISLFFLHRLFEPFSLHLHLSLDGEGGKSLKHQNRRDGWDYCAS